MSPKLEFYILRGISYTFYKIFLRLNMDSIDRNDYHNKIIIHKYAYFSVVKTVTSTIVYHLQM